jgi:hypothetical protein
MSNPEIEAASKREKLLPLDGLMYAGKKYAGDMNIDHPYVSPIYGDLNSLGEIMMFYSANEIFVPDCEKLIELTKNATGTTVIPFKEDGLFHDYFMAIFKSETKVAFEKISDFFLDA